MALGNIILNEINQVMEDKIVCSISYVESTKEEDRKLKAD